MIDFIINYVNATPTEITIVDPVIIENLEILTKSYYYFFGIFCFLLIVSWLWRK